VRRWRGRFDAAWGIVARAVTDGEQHRECSAIADGLVQPLCFHVSDIGFGCCSDGVARDDAVRRRTAA
jgi:hypothetical protein